MTSGTGNRDARQAFDELYATHRQTVYAYFLGKTSDPELALDLLQDTFIRVWRHLRSVQDLVQERQRAWLFSVARNLVIDHYRAHRTLRATADALVREAAVGDQTDVAAETTVLRSERLVELDRAIGQLPEDLRMVLVLSVVGERTSHEIGALLGRPPGTVRYQLAEARRRLTHSPRLLDVVNE